MDGIGCGVIVIMVMAFIFFAGCIIGGSNKIKIETHQDGYYYTVFNDTIFILRTADIKERE